MNRLENGIIYSHYTFLIFHLKLTPKKKGVPLESNWGTSHPNPLPTCNAARAAILYPYRLDDVSGRTAPCSAYTIIYFEIQW